jgi:hypothetical protein
MYVYAICGSYLSLGQLSSSFLGLVIMWHVPDIGRSNRRCEGDLLGVYLDCGWRINGTQYGFSYPLLQDRTTALPNYNYKDFPSVAGSIA